MIYRNLCNLTKLCVLTFKNYLIDIFAIQNFFSMRISVNLFQKLLKSNKMPVTEASSSNIASSPHKKLKLDDTKLMVAKLSEHATLPSRGSPLAAGYDLYSAEVRCSV